MVIITAWAWIHRSNQHKAAWVFNGKFSSGNCDHTIFKRLTHHLQNSTLKFGQFIEKQHSVMRQRNLSRLRELTTTDKSHIRNSMMRTTKRPLSHQGSIFTDFTGYRMDFSRFQRFFKGERRQNSRNAFSKHGLP